MLDMLFIQIIIFKFYYKFEEITRNESLILSKRTKISTSKIYNQQSMLLQLKNISLRNYRNLNFVRRHAQDTMKDPKLLIHHVQLKKNYLLKITKTQISFVQR